MTDQPGTAPPVAPITVKAHATPIYTSEMIKAFVVAGCAAAADRLMHAETVIYAAIPAFVIGAVVAWGLLHRLHTWRCMKFLARQVPDDVATVGKPS